MLYLAIDQHRKPLTVNVRDEEGRMIIARQVSTQWARVRAFFEDRRPGAQAAGGLAAIVEVCGFNDWLIKLLEEFGCVELLLIQPTSRSRTKTDRRDAATLGELLWLNRGPLSRGEQLKQLRRIHIPSDRDVRHVKARCTPPGVAGTFGESPPRRLAATEP
jgi:transposase